MKNNKNTNTEDDIIKNRLLTVEIQHWKLIVIILFYHKITI